MGWDCALFLTVSPVPTQVSDKRESLNICQINKHWSSLGVNAKLSLPPPPLFQSSISWSLHLLVIHKFLLAALTLFISFKSTCATASQRHPLGGDINPQTHSRVQTCVSPEPVLPILVLFSLDGAAIHPAAQAKL